MAQSQGGTVCPECGAAIAPTTQFCGECGAKVPPSPQPAESAAAAAAAAFKPRAKAHTMMGIDSQASKFASALAQVEARAKAETDSKKRGTTGSDAAAAVDQSPADQSPADQSPADQSPADQSPADQEAAEPADAAAEDQARAAAEAEAEAIIARAQAEAEKAYAVTTVAGGEESGHDAESGEATPAAESSSEARPDAASAADLDESGAVKAELAAASASHSESAGASAEAEALSSAKTLMSGAGLVDAATASDAAAAAEGAVDSGSAAAAASVNTEAASGSADSADGEKPAAAASPKPAPKVIVPERGTPAAARAAARAAQAKRGLAHTMLGLSDEVIKGASIPPPATSLTTRSGSSIPPSRDADGGGDPSSLPRGITPVPVTQVNASGKRAGSVPSRAAPKGTLLGIQTSPGSIPAPSRGLDKTQIEGEQPEGDAAGQAYHASGAAALGSTRVEGTRGTALGLGIPQAAPKRGAAGGPQGRTMLGVPVASISPPAAADAARSGSLPPRDSVTTRPLSEDPSIPPSVPARASARTRNVVILASLALLTIIAMVYLRLSGSASDADVSARIMTGPEGETLLFEVPDAREGSSIRFGGQEQPLVAGRATFALASDSLRVGENVVLADVVAPDGETSSARIVLSVFYRIWVDTASLRVDKPTVDVIVTAVPGTKVTLEGQDVPLDKQGRATKTYPVDIKKPGKGGVIEHVVHYRMQPPEGEPVSDELHTRIAVAMMQIDRPGPDIVTDRESIEIAGAVGRDTQVDIDGSAVPVKDGRFQHNLPLPRAGDYRPRVTAKAAGKIPYELTLNIKRVRDLAQAAREFSYNKDLNYAKIAAEPTQFKGQSIAMEGRVYATVPRAGSSVIQMLARPCPGSQRCSVWVVDPQGTEVAVDRFVRVLGVVDGEQQFRSEKNEIVTVPKIIARFVLPAKP